MYQLCIHYSLLQAQYTEKYVGTLTICTLDFEQKGDVYVAEKCGVVSLQGTLKELGNGRMIIYYH